jgi:hypothetical protein
VYVSDDLDQLLARGRLSGPQRDRVLDKVLVKTALPRRLRFKHVVLAAPLVGAAAALILLPKAFSTAGEGPEFSGKGSGGSRIEATCSGGPLSACPAGSTLVFRFDGVSRAAYVHAYATPLPPSAGERVWYFPTKGMAPPQLSGTAPSEVLRKVVIVGPEHAASAYEITVVQSAEPLTREQVLMLRPGDGPTGHSEVLQLGVVH